ncbi:vang-like protein 2 [Crassostrea angulata]|uniref:Vang-like protein n=4 Tax=Magallana gigas TaxID=29159 RepID=A0A8W8KSD1_MAGGI|nr:vang-like protein 2 [Crassostrea gigas]XP_052721362.1 vang-like protein 2 [Crassostrea angulata]|eukprot:XP_011436082.1 PREDICTED: vang-like protein 2 [Crassostrea gigas]
MDGAESVRSGRSDRSERSRRSHGSHHHHRHHGSRHRGTSSDHGGHRPVERSMDERSVTIKTPGNMSDAEDRMMGEERIEVQVIPQDDNWGDNTTAITGNTSETGFSMEDMRGKFGKESFEETIGIGCARYVGTTLASILSVIAFLSPIAMVILPKLGINDWDSGPCKPDCEGLLISFAFKLLILAMGTFALFFRQPKATMPRVFLFRAVVLFLVFVLTFAFWLFYGVRIIKEQTSARTPTSQSMTEYKEIVQFAVSFVDALLFIHYIAVILLEIRQLQPMFVVKVVRSPDGESKCYSIGALSIQRAAAWILEQYYRDFIVYNPYLENAYKKPIKMSGIKFYDIDGNNSQNVQSRSRAIFAAAARRRDASHNDRFHEEEEYSRRVRKRRARLIVAAEEAFTHIKRMQEEAGGAAIPMDPNEAAQAVFPSMARALQKYLRITRQQPRYTMDSVLNHLASCISHDMTPKAFVERYLAQGVVIMNDKEYKEVEKWILVSDQLLTRELEHNSMFQLRQNDISLLCTVKRLPHFNLTEEVINPKTNKFVLRLNSETSV